MTDDTSNKILAIIRDINNLKRHPTPIDELYHSEFCFDGDEIAELAGNKGLSTGFTITTVEEWGGEDQGSDYGYVFKFSNDTLEFYLRCVGYYSSWDSTQWEKSSIVTSSPRQVTVIDWLPADNNPLTDLPELLI